ncbi:hypothetical protein WJX72_004945 [[Myrmecia] bisecta]|uniref:Tyrosine-specific transport protein n=1 Tax=[Myrmecia] bisecta TaxID=41462 RepID=A0AAW1P4R1_9CHLO
MRIHTTAAAPFTTEPAPSGHVVGGQRQQPPPLPVIPDSPQNHIVPGPSTRTAPALLETSFAGTPLASLAPAAAATGSLLGAVALITGSTVGAGILALPAVSAPAGFFPSTSVMLACWSLLALEAMAIAEVNLALRARRLKAGEMEADEVVTLRQMAESTLGPLGASAMSLVYLGLSYSLLTAYISKVSELLTGMSSGLMTPATCAVAFTTAAGLTLCKGGTGTADLLNRAMTAGLMVLFVGIIASGASHADWSALTTHADWSTAPQTVPIMFLALVFHDLIPVLCSYLGDDRGRVRSALLAGSAVPLTMFMAWNAVALSLVQQPGTLTDQGTVVAGPGLDPLALLMQSGGAGMGCAVAAFSLLAIGTSFIGTSLGLSATLTMELKTLSEALQKPEAADSAETGTPWPSTEQDEEVLRLCVFLVALAPPLALSLSNPGAFFQMLQAAGAYGMTLLYGVAPPLMAWSRRSAASSQPANSSQAARPMVPGGPFVLASLCSCATGIEVARIAADSGPSLESLGLHFGLFSQNMGTAANALFSDMAASDSALSRAALAANHLVHGF